VYLKHGASHKVYVWTPVLGIRQILVVSLGEAAAKRGVSFIIPLENGGKGGIASLRGSQQGDIESEEASGVVWRNR
jgi:hypothetical protein